MKLLGHICRLADETPAKQSLKESLKPQRNKIGRPKLTWMKQIKNDLENRGLIADNDFDNVLTLAQDRDSWRTNFGSLHESRKPAGVGCA